MQEEAVEGGCRYNVCSSSDLLLDFVNTRPHGKQAEQLDSSTELAGWMAGAGLIQDGEPVSNADAVAAHELRDAFGAVFRAHSGCMEGAALLPESEAYLDRTAERYPLILKVTAEGCQLLPSQTGAFGGFGGLFIAAADLASQGAWPRMKTCRNDSCLTAFLDKTRNSSGLYCSATCSSQASQRAYRNRLSKTPA